MVDETFDGSPGVGIKFSLPGDIIRRRHIATRASLRRGIVVLVVGDAEFEGYSIGLDEDSLQVLELHTGEVSSIALKYIVAITDGKPFEDLSREDKDVVDRRTAAFMKTSQAWLDNNWPGQSSQRSGKPPYNKTSYPARYARPTGIQPRTEGGLSAHADSKVRDGAGESRDQTRGQ